MHAMGLSYVVHVHVFIKVRVQHKSIYVE